MANLRKSTVWADGSPGNFGGPGTVPSTEKHFLSLPSVTQFTLLSPFLPYTHTQNSFFRDLGVCKDSEVRQIWACWTTLPLLAVNLE